MKTLYQENTNVRCFLQNRRGFLYILGTIPNGLTAARDKMATQLVTLNKKDEVNRGLE